VTEPRSYRFEPLDRRGVLLGLGASQVVVLVMAVVVALGFVTSWPGGGGFAAAAFTLTVGGLLCRPVAGRAPPQWLRMAASFASHRRTVAPAPPALSPGVALRLPAKTFVPGVYLCELPASGGHAPVGALLDEKSGTAAAILRAKGGSFCLLDDVDKEHKLAAWAAVLESFSASRSSLVRLQWCQRVFCVDSAPLIAHLHQTGDPASPGYNGHASLLGTVGRATWRHETLVVVTVRCRGRSGRGRPSPEGAAALRNEVSALRARMHGAGLACEGVLDGPGAAVALANFLVPSLVRAPGSYPWPLAVEERWGELRADGFWHRTYWVAEWPRSRVGPDFLSPLLVGTGRRSFSVVMAPVPPERAQRDAESSRTSQVADAQLRAQGGFLETARQRRQSEALEGREAELADGRGVFELAGFVTVSASERGQLDAASSELERAAGAAKLSLRRLYGQQKEALTWVLPFGRGL
jgi:hypothetical protein